MSDEDLKGIEDMDLGPQNDGEPIAVEEESAAPEVEEQPEPEEPTEEQHEEERRKKTGSQRAREKAIRLEAENEALRKLLLERKPEEPKPVAVKDDAPKLEDFEYDERAWMQATIKFEAKKLLSEERAQESMEAEKREWERKMEEGRSKFEDFDEVLRDSAQPSPILAKRIVKASTTPEVLHYLATHPKEYNAINRMTDSDDVADALADIKVKVKTTVTPTKKTSSAPPPIKPVTPRAAVVVNDRYKGIEDF